MFSAKTWFAKTSARVAKYESQVVKSNRLTFGTMKCKTAWRNATANGAN